MAIYLAGNGPHMMDAPFPAGVAIHNGTLDAAYTASCVSITNTSNLATTDLFTQNISEGWIHMESRFWSPNTTGRPWVYCDNSSGNALIAIRNKTGVGGTMQAEFWNGAAWETFGDWSNGGTGGKFQLDIYFKFDADGRMEVYQDKERVAIYSGDLSHLTASGLRRLRLGNPRSFGSDVAYHQQILVCDFPTLFAKVRQTLFNAAGALATMDGTVASINENTPDTNTADALITDTAGEISTFKAAARAIGTNEVKGIIASYNAQRAGSLSPNALRALLRIGGVNYYAPDRGLGYGNRQFREVWETNPATGLPWTVADAGSADLEVGIESRSI